MPKGNKARHPLRRRPCAPASTASSAAATIRACLSGVGGARRPGRVSLAHGGDKSGHHAALHRGHQPHPIPRRLPPRIRARPHQGPKDSTSRWPTLQRLGVGMLITIGGDAPPSAPTSWPPPRTATCAWCTCPRDRQTTSNLPHDICTFATRPRAPRRRESCTPDWRREDQVALVLRHRHGAGRRGTSRWGIGRPRGLTPRSSPRSSSGKHARLETMVGHARRRDREAPWRTGGRTRRCAGGGARRDPPGERSQGPRGGGGATRMITSASRDQFRRHHQRGGAERLTELGNLGDASSRRNIGYEAALAPIHPLRHGVHARPRVLRGRATSSTADRGAGVDPGRALQANPLPRHDGPGHRADARADGGQSRRPLQDRAVDPCFVSSGRTSRPATSCAPRGGRARDARRVQAAVPVGSCRRSRRR